MSKPTTTIGRVFEFDAGHRVLGQGGKCEHLHGHRYKVHVILAGEVDEVGLVVDFGTMKDIIEGWIDISLDHGVLVWAFDLGLLDWLKANGQKHYVMRDNPTAENIAALLYRELSVALGRQGVGLGSIAEVTVWETPNCWATYTPGRDPRC